MKSPDALRRSLETFEQAIGYHYHDREKAFRALVHSSWANENTEPGISSNERLEFMGDALLDYVFSMRLFQQVPELSEGDMSRLRALVVCEASLARVAESIGLGQWLLMGRGEDLNGGRSRPSILADAMEAIFGSICLDAGMEAAATVMERLMEPVYAAALCGDAWTDWKTSLQEQLQTAGSVRIAYRVVDSTGPDHARMFRVEVSCEGKVLGTGNGRSKKEAEQEAARHALESTGQKTL